MDRTSPSALVQRLQETCGDENVFWRDEDLLVWEYDAGFDRHPPTAVAVPGNADEVAAVVRAAHDAGVAVVPRGAGTGLSGGTIACAGAIVVSTTRLRNIVSIDRAARVAVVEPGVPNLEVSAAAREHGLFFAPDPASQRISTIGGNVGTNAGGPHCLRYGSMVQHVLGIEMVLPSGEVARFGGTVPDLPGYDCVPLIVGSEGTLGIVTKVWLRLLPLPEDVRTFVAIFSDVDSGARAASAIIASGVVPAAMEMLDQVTIGAVNAAFDVHLPEDAGSLLLVEIEGMSEETEDWAGSIGRILKKNGATDVRAAASAAERELLWKARKLGYAALARIRPNNYLHDAVVPRTKMPDVLRQVNAIAERYGYVIANMFHIGDGNLHPVLLFDARTEPIDRVMEASAEILKVAIDAGGALSGEHGIGLEKNHFMFWVFGPEDLDAQRRARDAFDPAGGMNPGKIFPGGDACADIPTERTKRALAEGMWV
ncbi:MAG TPA: FAD-linked oxidase C-terminal domain-containing protein [Candidatus Limnocylindria bacterium]|nr:FAD-linked oxidase C-terminal domain-containing protein [Candidatus Limnocylindria bacterium]